MNCAADETVDWIMKKNTSHFRKLKTFYCVWEIQNGTNRAAKIIFLIMSNQVTGDSYTRSANSMLWFRRILLEIDQSLFTFFELIRKWCCCLRWHLNYKLLFFINSYYEIVKLEKITLYSWNRQIMIKVNHLVKIAFDLFVSNFSR